MSGLVGLAAGLAVWWVARPSRWAWVWGVATFLVVGLAVLEATGTA